jgi:hypothetical protein
MTERLTRGASRGGFQYQRRDPIQHTQRLEKAGGSITDPYLKSDIQLWSPKVGLNVVRLVPPTWPDPQHYGFDLWLHYNVGPEKGVYACLKRMQNQPCCICEEIAEAEKSQSEADKKYASELKAGKRVMSYIVDRNEEKKGVQAWSMPWTMDRDILAISMDRRTKEVYAIDDPNSGFDVEFERKGTGLNTEYIGIALARRESTLGDPKWLDFAVSRPLPDQIVQYDYEHIKKVFFGKGTGPAAGNPVGGAQVPAEEPVRQRTSVASPAQDHSYETLHALSFDEMAKYAESKGLNLDFQSVRDAADLADWIAELLHLTPAPAAPAQAAAAASGGGGDSAQDRLARLRRG